MLAAYSFIVFAATPRPRNIGSRCLGAGRLRAPMIMTRIKATSPMAAMDRRGLAPHLSNTGRLTEVCLAHMGTVRDSSPALPV